MKRSLECFSLMISLVINVFSQNLNHTNLEPFFTSNQNNVFDESDTRKIKNDYGQLAEGQKKVYNRKKITVEITKLEGDIGFSENTIDYLTYRWEAFKGVNTRISKQEFLRITGYKQESELERRREVKKTCIGVGAIAFVSGILLAAIPSINSDMDSDEFGSISHPHSAPGLCIAGCGTGLFLYGFLNDRNYQIPYSIAQSLADDYNQKLLLNIQKSN